MGQYFLASVGTANAFVRKKINGQEGIYHAFTARTLTDSSISITSTQEEIRGGMGAKLYGRFSHDTGFTVALTDTMFKLEYLAMQVSAQIDSLSGNVMFSETRTYESDGFHLTKDPMKIGSACGLDKIGVWFRPVGCDAAEDYHFVSLATSTKNFTSADAVEDSEYVVTYFVDQPGARTMKINADFVPAEMILILTTKLFAGDASNPESGRPVGELTIKIPRFQLDGAVDLSMAMSAASTFSLNGTALAVNTEHGDSDGVYAEIVEYLNGKKAYEGLQTAYYDYESDTCYGVWNGGYTAEIDGSEDYFVLVAPTTSAAGSLKINDTDVTPAYTRDVATFPQKTTP